MVNSRLPHWTVAVFFSSLIHVFFLMNVIVILPVRKESVNPEIFFLGSILMTPDLRGDIITVGREVDPSSRDLLNKHFTKKESRYSRVLAEKPFLREVDGKSKARLPQKTLFPIDNGDLQKNDDQDQMDIPKEYYQPLKLEFHDSR